MTTVHLPADMPLAAVYRLAREHGLVVRWDHETGAFRVEALPRINNLAAPAAGDGSTGGWPAAAGLVALDAGVAGPKKGGDHG